MNVTHTTGQSSPEMGKTYFNNTLMRRAMFFWFLEIALSAINFFVLINLVYEPHWGNPVAHQIGMSTRIIYIFVLAYFLLRPIKQYTARDLLFVGVFWMGFWLIFEWGGSLLYMTPYIIAHYNCF